MAKREHQETRLGGNVRQSLSVGYYEKLDIYENENRADVRAASAPALAQQAQESEVDTPETSPCKTIMVEREHQKSYLGGNVRKNLSVSEVVIHQNENCVAVRTASAPVVLQTRLSGNNGQNHCEHRDEIKKNGLKWLVVYFVLAAVIITGIFQTAFMFTFNDDLDHDHDQKTKILLENFKKTLTSRIDEEHGKENHTALLLENLQKNLTSFIDKAHGEDQETKILLENLKKNLTSRIDEVHGEDQKTKILLEILKKNLTSMIDEAHCKDNHTALLLENLQKNLTSFINNANTKNQQMKTNFEVLQKNLTNIINISLHGLNLTTERIDLLERQIQELNSTVLSLQIIVAAVHCEDGFFFQRNCYFAIIHASRDIEFQNISSTCGSRGGRIGNILNLDHQILAENYTRPKIPATENITWMWLALIYNSSTSSLTTSDGNSFPKASLRWHPNYPTARPNVLLRVSKDPSERTGVFNYVVTVSTKAYGVFCEM